MSRVPVFVCVAVVAIASAAAAQDPTFPSHDVRIEVVVFASGRASVRERFQLSRPLDRVQLETRGDRCARIGPVLATLGDATLRFEEKRRGPWVVLSDSKREGTDSAPAMLDVRYDVELGEADATLPILLPSAPLERIDGARGARVVLTVRFDEDLDGADVLFPRLDRLTQGPSWQGELLAIPSLVRLRLPRNEPTRCSAETPAPTGGLEWRFWLFAGIMAVWVPVYLWIFGRPSRDTA